MNRRNLIRSALAIAFSGAICVSGALDLARADDAAAESEPMVLRVYSDYV